MSSLLWPSVHYLISWYHPFTLRLSRCPSDVFSARLHVPTKRCPCCRSVPTKRCPCCLPVPTKRCPCCRSVPTKRCPCLLLQGTAAVGCQSFRPHTCSQCGKRFVSLNGLRLHEYLHKGRYRYKCSYCGKGFSGSTNLRGHLVTHTLELRSSVVSCASVSFDTRASFDSM